MPAQVGMGTEYLEYFCAGGGEALHRAAKTSWVAIRVSRASSLTHQDVSNRVRFFSVLERLAPLELYQVRTYASALACTASWSSWPAGRLCPQVQICLHFSITPTHIHTCIYTPASLEPPPPPDG